MFGVLLTGTPADGAAIVSALRCVTRVIPETDWAQKRRDIEEFHVDIFGMGHDWAGKFDDLTHRRYAPARCSG